MVLNEELEDYERAEKLIDEWEKLENESMRDGHRFTLTKLILELIDEERSRWI